MMTRFSLPKEFIFTLKELPEYEDMGVVYDNKAVLITGIPNVENDVYFVFFEDDNEYGMDGVPYSIDEVLENINAGLWIAEEEL